MTNEQTKQLLQKHIDTLEAQKKEAKAMLDSMDKPKTESAWFYPKNEEQYFVLKQEEQTGMFGFRVAMSRGFWKQEGNTPVIRSPMQAGIMVKSHRKLAQFCAMGEPAVDDKAQWVIDEYGGVVSYTCVDNKCMYPCCFPNKQAALKAFEKIFGGCSEKYLNAIHGAYMGVKPYPEVD